MTGSNSISRHAWIHSSALKGSPTLSEKVLRMMLDHLSQRKGNVADRRKLRDLSRGVCVKMFADAVLWGAVKRGYVTETKTARPSWIYDYTLTEEGRAWLARGS